MEGVPVQKKFSLQAINVLSELRQTGQLCDAIIRAENEDFPIHRAFMSACSPYFRALFTNELFDSFNKREVVNIPGVSADIMKLIIDYAYTQDVLITADNVERLLPAADQFHINGLVKTCCDFLLLQISNENVIGIRAFAHAYFCHNLEKSANNYLMKHFSNIFVVSNEYLQLNIDELCDIIDADELNVRNEELVFDSILRWIDYDSDRRKNCIARLLRVIRLGLLSTQFFVEKVKPHEYVKNNDTCKSIVIETLKFLYDLDMDEGKEIDLANPLAKPRIPHEILFVFGGWSGGSPTNAMETYDTRADRWINCEATDAGPRAYHGAATLYGLVYLIGGFDGVEYFSSVRCFDPVGKTWSEVAPMNCKRCYVSVTVMDNLIYVLGGFDGHIRQNTAEKYTPGRNQWSVIRAMHQPRSDASAASLNGKVYICGGFNGQECLNTAEAYDTTLNQWTMIAPMRNLRSGVQVIEYRGCVYALGGFNGITRMNTGEKFNPSTNNWQSIPEMYNPRSNFATEVIDDMIFAIGGFNGVTTIFSVECYDGSTDEWYDATDMNMYRSALSACVVSQLPNIADYIHKDRNKKEDSKSKRT